MHVDADHAFQRVSLHRDEAAHLRHRRVVYQHADFDVGDGAREFVRQYRVRQVDRQIAHLHAVMLPQLRRQLRQYLHAPRQQQQVHAALGKLRRKGSSQALGGPCNHGPLSVTRHIIAHFTISPGSPRVECAWRGLGATRGFTTGC